MTKEYIVATGIVDFRIQANSPAEALAELKGRFVRAVGDRFFDSRRWGFGVSLVDAQKEGRLNYLVFDREKTDVLCGELEGVYQEPASRRLLDSMRRHLTQDIYRRQLEKLSAEAP